MEVLRPALVWPYHLSSLQVLHQDLLLPAYLLPHLLDPSQVVEEGLLWAVPCQPASS